MPPRWFSLIVVLCWLATSSWLFHRDLWPHLQADESPPFTIDLADEAQLQVNRIRWNVLRPDKDGETKIGRARTWVEYRTSDDTFELHSEIEQMRLGGGLMLVRVPHMASMYRVNRDGHLKEMTADVKASLVTFEIKAHISGQVRDRQFWPKCQVETSLWGKQDVVIKPVEVSAHGTVLNPLHPVNRLTGLRPGQRWRMPVVDPLADALAAKLAEEMPSAKVGPRFLDAEVLPEIKTLLWNKEQVPCLVIEYRGDDITARTWVRQSDGLVLRQEANRENDRVILQRE